MPNDLHTTTTLAFKEATIALFAFGDVKPDTVASLVAEMRLTPWLKLRIDYGSGLLCWSRSVFLSKMLRETSEDILLMIDHDIVWQPGDLTELAMKCRETKGIVSGLYPRRAFGQGPTVRFLEQGMYSAGEDKLVMASHVGAGFLAVHREAAEKIAATMPKTKDGWPFFMPIIDDPLDGQGDGMWGEDYSFSIKARQAGVPLYLWLKPEIDHVGQYRFRMVDGLATIPEKTPVTFNVMHPAIADLPQDLAEFFGMRIEDVAAAAERSTGELAKLWNNPKDEPSWYQSPEVSRLYILDLASWHLGEAGPMIQDNLRGITGKRCLDYGAGIGTWSLMLTETGNEVDYVEPGQTSAEFIAFRTVRRKRFAKAAPPRRIEQPDGLYDVVICWHVLEHVEHPQETVALLVDSLAPGGLLITQSNFVRNAMHPMHHTLPSGLTVDDFWAAAGLIKTAPNCWRRNESKEEGTLCLATARTAR